MRISETFLSLQGESRTSGIPTFFIRTAGCNLRCDWCDTQYSFYGGTEQTLEQLIDQCGDSGARQVCLTGGEPMLEPDLPALCVGLEDKGFQVQVETGGHMDTTSLPRKTRRIVDLKCPSSKESGSFLWSNLLDLKPEDDLKVVVADRQDLDWAINQLDQHQGWGPHQVLVSPVADRIPSTTLADWMLEYPGKPWRFQLQLHKLLWGNRRRT